MIQMLKKIIVGVTMGTLQTAKTISFSWGKTCWWLQLSIQVSLSRSMVSRRDLRTELEGALNLDPPYVLLSLSTHFNNEKLGLGSIG